MVAGADLRLSSASACAFTTKVTFAICRNMAEYGSATVPLSQVCEKYFGLKPATAEKRAAMGEIPIPTFRAAESQKAPRMIHIQDLANHIDAQLKKGRDLLEQMKSDS